MTHEAFNAAARKARITEAVWRIQKFAANVHRGHGRKSQAEIMEKLARETQKKVIEWHIAFGDEATRAGLSDDDIFFPDEEHEDF